MTRALVVAAALAATALASSAASAGAADGGGIAGYVVDGSTGRGVPGQRVLYYRAPYVEDATVVTELRTDSHGYFGDITLAPGRYVVAVAGPTQLAGCAVEEVFGGEITRVRIALERQGAICSQPPANPALVDPGATADVYRV